MKLTSLIVILVVSPAFAPAQEINVLHPADTLVFKNLVFSPSANSLSNPSLLSPAWLYDTVLSRDFPASYLGYALTSAPAASDRRADLSWQMNSLRSDDPLGSVRMVLGAVSAGGAAYFAYQHIKKYGFLK